MSAPGFLVVHPLVARNPVARAIAVQRTRAAVRDFQTRLYLLADGERVESDGVAAAQVLYAAYVAMDQAGRARQPEARVIHGAISALQQLALRRWAWRPIDAPAIDQALIHASHVLTTYPASAVQRAWADLQKVDALVAAERGAAFSTAA